MNWGKDDCEMYTMAEAEEIEYAANRRGHRFECECQQCSRTKALAKLITEKQKR